MRRWRWLVPTVLVLGGGLWLGLAHRAEEPAVAAADVGRGLYVLRQCSTCHAMDGVGGEVGCDLSRVGKRREEAWMARWLVDPQKVRPGTSMPNMGLKDSEARAIAAYLATRK